MASSSFGESRGILVVGIRNTYCECSTRARIMIPESERNPNRLYATCAKFPKCNYYVWLTPRGFGGCEPGNEDTNNSEQFPVDNINFAVLEARVCSSISHVRSGDFDVQAVEPPNYWHREMEYGMMNRLLLLQQLLPPFHVEQLLPFLVPFPVQLSFSVPWSEASQSTGHVQKAPGRGVASLLPLRSFSHDKFFPSLGFRESEKWGALKSRWRGMERHVGEEWREMLERYRTRVSEVLLKTLSDAWQSTGYPESVSDLTQSTGISAVVNWFKISVAVDWFKSETHPNVPGANQSTGLPLEHLVDWDKCGSRMVQVKDTPNCSKGKPVDWPLMNMTASATTSACIFFANAMELTSSRVALVNILPIMSVISRTTSFKSSLFPLHLFLFLEPDEASVPPSTAGPSE
ncbi:sister chromatid cohesion protein PDS5-like protein [Senna tora]|uniref:Sister chromatid cohesion protein PDS5-like protein n=1 Tax=Senna tora TaxID=362788 RepID=A0A834W8Z8_9FABA|nr:sister chromatid cohesion protein PDS5-like protein [Senna tora]